MSVPPSNPSNPSHSMPLADSSTDETPSGPAQFIGPLLNEQPVPPPISTKPGQGRSFLDGYVKAFALDHGYEIAVAHSDGPNTACKYMCSRGGQPWKAKPKGDGCDTETPHSNQAPVTQTSTSKSVKIGCRFQMIARLDGSTFTLYHKITGHNHMMMTPEEIEALKHPKPKRSSKKKPNTQSEDKEIEVCPSLAPHHSFRTAI